MRLFFALWPPEHVAAALAAEADALAHKFGGKPTRQETIHLTLAFLGEVDTAQLPLVQQAASAVCAEPFALSVDRLGGWRHNRLLWAGCHSPAPGLQVLAEGLRQELRALSIGYDDKQGFTPHLTLVRKLPDARIIAGLPAIEPMTWPCAAFVLASSQQGSGGSGYRILGEEFPLQGR